MNRPAPRWGAAGLSGLLLAAAFPPFGLWPLAWVALVPLWRAVRAAPDPHAAADLGGLAGFVFAAAALPWLTKTFSFWAAALWCVFALGPGLHAFLMKGLQGRWGGGNTGALAEAAAAALLWAGVEAARAHLPRLACPWLTLGFSQAPCLPVVQWAAVFGVYGVSAAIAAANAALVLALERRRVPAEALLGVLATAWVLGGRRVTERPDSGRPARVALVQDEGYDLERLAKLTLSAEARDADLVVWPEYQVAVTAGREDAYRRFVASKVAGARGIVAVGAAILPDDPKGPIENFTWLLAPGGGLLGRYDKAHPIPLIERRLRGHSDPRPVATPLGKLGLQICYDLDFEDGARRLARQGARLLVVTDLDPAEWGPAQHAQHAAMASFRAAESGLWVAKSASSGDSQLIDPLGRVRASLGFAKSGVVAGEVRLADGHTPYAAWGWLLVPLSLLGLAGAVLDAAQAAFRRRARAAYPPASPTWHAGGGVFNDRQAGGGVRALT